MRLIFIIFLFGLFKISNSQITIIEATQDTLYYFEQYANDSVTKEPILLIPGTKLKTNIAHYKIGGYCFVTDSEEMIFKELEKPEYKLSNKIKNLRDKKLNKKQESYYLSE